MKACEWGGKEARDKLDEQINAAGDGVDATARFLMNVARAAGETTDPEER